MFEKFIRPLKKFWSWTFGGNPESDTNDRDCPTCGDTEGFDWCNESEFDCEEISGLAKQLIEDYKSIWTENENRFDFDKSEADKCEWKTNKATSSYVINTGNRCSRVGEIRSNGIMTTVCLECQDCKGEASPRSLDKRSMSVEDLPNGDCMIDNSCPETDCGFWFMVNNARYERSEGDLHVQSRSIRNRRRVSPNVMFASGPGGIAEGCEPELIYDETGCKVIGVRPVLLSRGTLSYWESTEKYPDTKDCDGNYIYGEDGKKGNPIRHHKMPNRALEPHFISYTRGVSNALDPANQEWNNTYVRFIELELRNVSLPKNPSKPLNKNEPLTLGIIPRKGANKSVIGSGLFINTFKGNVHGEEFAIPKNGVNGPEYFDKNIYYGGNDTHRGGENMDVGAMVFHSPDTQFDSPPKDSDTVKYELNLKGQGWKYGQSAEGEEPETMYVGKENQRGTRIGVNMSHYNVPKKAINGCIAGISPAKANMVTDKGDYFTYPLMNIDRESSVYIETKKKPPSLSTINENSPNNGHPQAPLENDGSSDFSFLGGTLWHEHYIHDASAWYGNIKTHIPNQYGGLVNAVYQVLYNIPMREIKGGLVATSRGDSFINQHYVVRKAFVSDKTMRDVSPLIVGSGFPGDGASFFGSLFRKLFESIGLEECNTCPKSGNATDPRNGAISYDGTVSSHRALRQSLASGPWDGTGAPPVATGSDIYYPHILKTHLLYIVESDVNLKYRQTGEWEAGQYYYRKLHGKSLDSDFPRGSRWRDSLLNRFYIEMNENPRWKMVVRVIFNLLFTYGVGVWLVLKGLGMMLDAASELIVGLSFNIGAIVSALMALPLILLGALWIVFWANTDIDNRFWDNVLGIKGCWPSNKKARDRKYGAVRDSRFTTNDGEKRQFEDNYWQYNYDHSKGNTIDIGLGLPDPYSQRSCEHEPGFEILYSNKQNPTSVTDAYRNFKVNSYIEMPTNTGKIQKMFSLGARIFVQTTDAMYSLQTGGSSLATDEGDREYMDASNVLRIPYNIYGGVQEGKGGTLDPNACFVSEYGYLTIDTEARIIALFNGSSYKSLGAFGMQKFLDRFMPFRTEGIRDQKTPGGIGYSLGIDNKLKQLHITKHDGKYSWTLIYDLGSDSWVSFGYHQPLDYMWDRHDMYSWNGSDLWRHHKMGEYLTVYGEKKPMVIDFVISDQGLQSDFKWRNSEIDVEFSQWDEYGYIEMLDEHPESVGMYNSFQSSGLTAVVNHDKRSTMDKLSEDSRIVPMSRIGKRKWRFDKLYDKVQDKEVRHFTTWEEAIFTEFTNNGFIGGNPKSNAFIDTYHVMRLVFDSPKNIRVFLKNVASEINNEYK